MTTDMAIVFAVLLASLVMFVREWVSVDVTALLGLAVLLVTGVLEPDDALAGFANPAVITVAAMFVLSEGLSRTGAVNGITRAISGLAGSSGRGFAVLALVIVMTTSAFINNTAIVVLFIPVMLNLARRFRTAPSKLLIPISYVSILGGTCTLIGTSTNLLVDSVAREHGQPGFGMFEFGQVGAIVATVGFLYILLVAPKLLPERATMIAATDTDARQYVTEVEILDGSGWVGKVLGETALGKMKDLLVLEVIRGELILTPRPDLLLESGDLLLLQGDANALYNVDQSGQVSVLPELAGEGGRLGQQVDISLTEIVITPNSRFVGTTVREAGFRRRYNVSVFALQRGGRHLRRSIGDVELRIGDVLLVQGSQRAFENLQGAKSFLVAKGTDAALTRPARAWLAVAVMLAVIGGATFGGLKIEVCALLGALAMIVFRCISTREAYGAIDLTVLLLIVGTLGLGKAMDTSGAAAFVVDKGTTLVKTLGPHGILAALFVITATLTSLMSNNATAVLLTPLAIQLTASLGFDDARPFLLAVVFGSSAAFATPIGYQTNTLVFGPGGYYFRDYMRVGLPLTVITGIVACVTIPIFFPFR